MNTIISRCYRKEVFIESCAAILYSKECTWYNDSIILRRPPQGRMKSWRIRKRLCMLLLKRKIHALTVIFLSASAPQASTVAQSAEPNCQSLKTAPIFLQQRKQNKKAFAPACSAARNLPQDLHRWMRRCHSRIGPQEF